MKYLAEYKFHFYLTDLEWLLIYVCLYKPHGNKYFFCFETIEETALALRTLSSTQLLDIKIYPIDRASRVRRWKELLVHAQPSKLPSGITVSCPNADKLLNWVTDYLSCYQKGEVIAPGLSYEKSMFETLNILEQYEAMNPKIACVQKETIFSPDLVVSAAKHSHLFEDLYILARQGYIGFFNISYEHGKLTKPIPGTIWEEIQLAKRQLLVSVSLFFYSPVSVIREKVLGQAQKTKESVLPVPYNRFQINQTNPLSIETETIWYENKPLPLVYKTKEYQLLRILIQYARPVSYTEIFKSIPFSSYKRFHEDGEPLSGFELEARFRKNIKNYCSKLRKLLPGILVINEKEHILLR